jgi:hypothetical protein
LRLLVGETLLLLELVIHGLQASLLRLLLGLTRLHLRLSAREPRLLGVRANAAEEGRCVGAHAVTLLGQCGLLLGGAYALLVALLAKVPKLLRVILNGRAVGLPGAEAHALLLLRRRKGLIIVLLIEGRDGLSLRKALLTP